MTPAERRLQLDLADAIAHLLATANLPSWAEQIRAAVARVREEQKPST